MVLENLLSPVNGEKAPWKLFFIGFLYSTLGLLVGLFLFREYASLIALFFTTFAAVPTMYAVIKLEEKKDTEIAQESVLLKEHGRALALFTFLFLGFVAGSTIWHLVLPEALARDAFSVQESTLMKLNSPLTGHAIDLAGTFVSILFNNIKVLLFCLLFAFLYGFGAIFVLGWNASLIGVAISDAIKSYAGALAIPAALSRYLLHGVPEMIAYFMAGLAGGIISVAVINHDMKSEKFKRILLDSVDLGVGALVILVVAALLEVFVSPLVG
ncbi:MAG: stage II sporulation protein M [Nanoarchaeota archaeon]|nr:stage II sporulation protein M [Nanoarchaeota archaeon]